MEQAVNTFGEGLVTDYNPLLAPENTLTDALNATFVTMNGNEAMLQNDMGNGRVETAFLPSGFVPVGIKEHGGIIYVASHNPLTGESLIGSFPSPERNIDDREVSDKEGIPSPSLDDIVNREYSDDEWYIYVKERKRKELIQTIPLFNGKILNPGDKFAIVNSGGILFYKKYLSHCYNTEIDKVESPKLSESEISVLVLDSTKNLSDITDTLIRSNEDDKDLSQHSEEFKRNYKYFIWNDFNAESDESNYFNNNAKFENTRKVNSLNLNTYLNKFSGSLFLSRKYSVIDHIDYDRVSWKASTSDPTVVNGTLSFDLIYYYNCPDGFYLASNFELHPIIKWKKGNWKIEEANSPEGSVCSSSVNLNFDIPDQDSYEYCPKYDISTGLYKFIIPYEIGLKLENEQLIIKINEKSGEPIILISDDIKTRNNNDAINKVSDYNYITWIGQYYNYSVILGSNIEMNYNNGIGEFTITPKMYYSTPLEDLAISFTTQLGLEVTPEPIPKPTPGTETKWENKNGFGYFWYSKNNVNNYVLLFKESYLTEKIAEKNELRYTIKLVFYDYCYDENDENWRKLYKYSDENLSDMWSSNWNDVVLNDTYLKTGDENIKSYWRNINSQEYFGYVEINDNTIELTKGEEEPQDKYKRFWIFPKNINPYKDYRELFLTDGARDRTKDTFDVLYTTDFSENSPKLSASYYITGNAVSMDLGYKKVDSKKTYYPLYKSPDNLEFGNIKYIFAESVIPQSICLAIKQSITSSVLRTPYFMINYEDEESSSSFSPNKDYFYPCVYNGDGSYELLIPKILNTTTDPENISITDWWKDKDTPSLNFLTNEVSLQLYAKAGNYTQASTEDFKIAQDVEKLKKSISNNTLTELPKNYTEVND